MAKTRRVHIVGCHRSGTTLMMELMWYGFNFDGRTEHETTLFSPIPAGHSLYLTKKPPDTVRIEQVFRADEELFVIAMLRDPRSVITSRHPNRPDVYFSGFLRWREYARAIERLEDHPRYLLIRYESLIKGPDEVQARIRERFPFLTQTAEFSRYPEGAEVPQNAEISLLGVRAVDPSRINNWREHLPRVKGQLQAHPEMTDYLIRFGYENDTSWTAGLEGVDTYTQQYKDDAPHLLKAWEANFRQWRKSRAYLRWRARE